MSRFPFFSYLPTLLLLTSFAFAQLHVQEISPSFNSVGVEADSSVSIAFSEEINVATLNSNGIKVHGNQTGYYEAAGFSYDLDSHTVVVSLKSWFKPGESITVTVTTEIESAAGASLDIPFASQFTVANAVGSGSFEVIQTVSVGSGSLSPYGMVGADFNGDGYIDLATADRAQGNISILLNDGSGTFSVDNSYSAGSTPDAIAAADIDGDGDIDLGVANSTVNNTNVLKNNGNGVFTLSQTLGAGSYPHGIAAADIDSDGDMDFLVNNLSSSNITLLENDGSGNFSSSILTTTGSGPEQPIVGDIDNDGDLDFASPHFNVSTMIVRTNDGTGGFNDSYNISVSGSSHLGAGADLTGDGWFDLITSHNNGGSFTVLANDGTGTITTLNSFSPGFSPWSAATGDINADGLVDFFITHYSSSGQVSVWLNNGAGEFDELPAISTGSQPHVAVVADFNGDDILDLATANDGANSVSIAVGDAAVDIDANHQDQLPRRIQLSQNFPNPFNPSTVIRYHLPGSRDVRLSVYNIQGQLVKVLVSSQQAANGYEVVWDGTDNSGSRVSSGLYLYRLEDGLGDVQVKKMMLLQ